MKTTSQSKGEKEETVVVKRVSEEKAVEDMCKLLKALDSQKAVLKKNK